ncbi:MAG: MBL fold metallo-hydrolase, partial [Clostridia bacterium]|nr:MBL fold metallo-hydrolase [Clostridia bacterium]
FSIGDLDIRPFPIPHDAADPVGYAVSACGAKVAVATDIGAVRESWLREAEAADVLLLEANHDVDTLKAGRYPYELKRRILSNRGHLSNDDAGAAAVELVRRGVRVIVLGHLSGENNFPELAYASVACALEEAGFKPGRELMLSVARRDGMSELFTLGEGDDAHAVG